MEPLLFRIPEQRPPEKGAFDTRPAALRAWVDELPMGNTGEAARRINHALREVNALAISPDDRVAMLELMAPRLEELLDALERHYDGSHLPMPSRPLRIAQFSNQLLEQVIIAYQSVLSAEEESSWLFRLTHHRLWPLCVQRLLHYLGRLLGNFRLMHRATPAGLWLAVHRLYAEARTHGKLESRLELPWEADRKESISESYRRLLLGGLLEPQLFSRTQLETVYRLMPLWLGQAKLREPQQWHASMECYCIQLAKDTPYTFQAEGCREGEAGEAMLLDITPLGKLLDEALAEGDGTEEVSLAGSDISLPYEVVKGMRQCWQVPLGGRSQRYKSERPVEVAVGLSGVFSLMRQQRDRRRDGISDQPINDERIPLLPLGAKKKAKPAPKEPEVVWDNIFFGTVVKQNSWALGAEEKDYQYIPARELDYNEHGYCLEFARESLQSLDVGELLGLSQARDEPLQLCMVRWLQEGDKTVLVGLVRLAREVEPVITVLSGDEQETSLGSLLGIGEDQRPQLFLPHLPNLQAHEPFIVVERRELPIVLCDRVSLSPLFEGYHWRFVEGLDVGSIENESSLERLNTLLHSAAHSDEREPRHAADDFSDLWDSL